MPAMPPPFDDRKLPEPPPSGGMPKYAAPRRTPARMAPPAAAPPPSDAAADSGKDTGCRSTLLELRAEIQQLLELIDNISKGEPVEPHVGYITKTMADIEKLMPGVKDARRPEEMRRIHNYLEQLQAYSLLTHPAKALKPDEQAHQITRIKAIFARVIWEIGYYIIPQRLNDWLAEQRPGFFVPFDDVFEDELPDSQDRKKILHVLKFAPIQIPNGLVEEETGLVYRYEPRASKRLSSYLLILLALVLAAGLPISAAYWPIKDWIFAPKDVVTLAFSWAAVMVGLIVHIMVGGAKRLKATGGQQPIMAIGEIWLWANAKAGKIALKMLLTLIGFFGFMYITGVDKATPWEFFLVGYSLDSFVELFGATVEQKAAKQVEAVQKKLQPTEG